MAYLKYFKDHRYGFVHYACGSIECERKECDCKCQYMQNFEAEYEVKLYCKQIEHCVDCKILYVCNELYAELDTNFNVCEKSKRKMPYFKKAYSVLLNKGLIGVGNNGK